MKQKLVAYYSCCLLAIFCSKQTYAQVVLEANGPGSTYELINSKLAPGATAVESPDQCASHPSFGRHIAEVFDAMLNQFVFEFYIHVPTTFPVVSSTADNDRCLNFDRQRVEVKTYEPSPDSLKGTVGETVTYKWKFRLPSGFQSSTSFTHIHQIKAVGGDEDDPIFTLTTRAGTSSNSLQLLYYNASINPSVTLSSVNLSSFLGTWVEVTEQIKYGPNGTFSIVIKRVSDDVTLLNYANNNILTFRSDNSFARPKWGIYRSLNSPTVLRDDSIRLASITIFEGLPPAAPTNLIATATSVNSINITWQDNASNESKFIIEQSLDGLTGWNVIATLPPNTTSYTNLGLNANTFYYYRLKADNIAGQSAYTSIANAKTLQALPVNIISFNTLLINKQVQLNWKVSNETNFKGYEVEWSKDGRVFSTLTLIKPIGTNSYYYVHQMPSNGLNYYRLKMINLDGSFNYSSIQSIKISISNSIKVFPNPTKEFLYVQLNESPNSTTKIIIINAVGQQVQSFKPNELLNKISLINLRRGLYQIQLFSYSAIVSKELVFIN